MRQAGWLFDWMHHGNTTCICENRMALGSLSTILEDCAQRLPTSCQGMCERLGSPASALLLCGVTSSRCHAHNMESDLGWSLDEFECDSAPYDETFPRLAETC